MKLDSILVHLRYQDGFFAEEAEEEMDRSTELQLSKNQIKVMMLDMLSKALSDISTVAELGERLRKDINSL